MYTSLGWLRRWQVVPFVPDAESISTRCPGRSAWIVPPCELWTFYRLIWETEARALRNCQEASLEMQGIPLWTFPLSLGTILTQTFTLRHEKAFAARVPIKKYSAYLSRIMCRNVQNLLSSGVITTQRAETRAFAVFYSWKSHISKCIVWFMCVQKFSLLLESLNIFLSLKLDFFHLQTWKYQLFLVFCVYSELRQKHETEVKT